MDLKDPHTWSSIYDVIRHDMGFSYSKDYWAASIASLLCLERSDVIMGSEGILKELISGGDVLVVGAAPSCRRVGALRDYYDVVVAADGATRCCLESGVVPNVIVTDLDGLTINELAKLRRPVYVVHIHGDNVDKLLNYWYVLKSTPYIVLTTQVWPPPSYCLRVYGGFTDGDRAVFTSYYFGARKVGLIGFEFSDVMGRYSKPWLKSDTYLTTVKRKKLNWARRLLRLIEYVASGDVSIEHHG